MVYSVREARISYRKIREEKSVIQEPEQISALFRKLQWNNVQEQFMLFCLDGSHTVISASVVFVGTANSATAHPREIFQIALLCGACAIVVAHNHPSESLSPSPQDREVTHRLNQAGKLLGIPLLDHIIVTETGFNSAKLEGWFPLI